MRALPDEVISFRRYLKRRGCASNTVRSYLSDLRLFLDQVGKPVVAVTVEDVESFIEAQQSRGLSATTINRRLAAVRRLYVWLRQSEHPELPVPVRPALHRVKQPDPLPRCLRQEEIERLFAVIEEVRDRALFLLMLRAGLRVQEVSALQMEQVDLKRQQVVVPPSKNGKGRVVYLSLDALVALQSYLAQRPESECPQLFLVPAGRGRGQGISVRGIQKRLELYAARAGVPLSCHGLRHTFASQLLENGADIVTVQMLLGHAHVTTTQRYARVSNPKVRDDYFQGMAQVLQKQQEAGGH